VNELFTLRPMAVLTALLVPLLTLAAPAWLRLAGIGPAWAVLWLLPWAMAEGRRAGLCGALGLGLLLDSLHPGPVTLLPGLLLLGWWWGRLGRRRGMLRHSLSLGLLALVGTALLNLSLLLQWLLQSFHAQGAMPSLAEGMASISPLLHQAGPPAAILALPVWERSSLLAVGGTLLLAQTLLTALLAPWLCSLQLLLWRHLGAGIRAVPAASPR